MRRRRNKKKKSRGALENSRHPDPATQKILAGGQRISFTETPRCSLFSLLFSASSLFPLLHDFGSFHHILFPLFKMADEVYDGAIGIDLGMFLQSLASLSRWRRSL